MFTIHERSDGPDDTDAVNTMWSDEQRADGAETLTEYLAALRREAATAGDLAQVALCDRAAQGDRDAEYACVATLRDAHAARDAPCTPDCPVCSRVAPKGNTDMSSA